MLFFIANSDSIMSCFGSHFDLPLSICLNLSILSLAGMLMKNHVGVGFIEYIVGVALCVQFANFDSALG